MGFGMSFHFQNVVFFEMCFHFQNVKGFVSVIKIPPFSFLCFCAYQTQRGETLSDWDPELTGIMD